MPPTPAQPIRGTSPVTSGVRRVVREVFAPIAIFLGRIGLTPNALTLVGFLITLLGAILLAGGHWLAGGLVVLFGGIFDLFDGTLARATGRVSRFGAFMDSTLDRWGEAAVYVGIVIGSTRAGFELGAWLAAAAMASAFLVSYVRARAEGLGFENGSGMAAVGLAPREVRLVVLTAGLVATGLGGGVVPGATFGDGASTWLAATGDIVLAGTLALIAFLASLTVIQRILHVQAQSEHHEPQQPG